MSTSTMTRPPFRVEGSATIKHLNIRKEGPDDDKVIAVDIKMEITKVDRRLCAYFDEALEAFLWRGDTNALIVRNTFVEPVKYLYTLKDATVQINTRELFGCKVSKFQITPKDGGVIDLTLTVSALPTKSEVAELANLVSDGAAVSINGPLDLFADEGGGA